MYKFYFVTRLCLQHVFYAKKKRSSMDFNSNLDGGGE